MLTRAGWAALAAAVGSVLTGRLFGLLELYVLGVGVAIVVLVSWMSVNRQLPVLDVRRTARPHSVSVGEPARVDLFVANRGHRSTPRLRLWEPVGERGGAPMQLAPLAPGDSATAAYRVPTSQRGILRTGPLQAERSDLLGLCRRTALLAGTGEVLVMPQWLPLTFPGIASNGRLGEHLRIKAMGRTGTEFHSQREYSPGDDLRRINWKSTARTGTLIVREPALENVHRCTVVLDTRRDSYDADAFERAVSAAASIIAAASNAGANTRLVAPSLDIRGTEVMHESLRWLATVEMGDVTADPFASGRAYGDGLGLLVVVTGAPGSAAHVNARSGAGPDESLVVVSTAVATGSGRFVVDATSLDRLERNWNHLVAGHGSVTA